MQGELAHSYMGVLGQRTLLKRLHQLQALTPGADERPTPPLLQLDAIWFTQLCATGQYRTDSKGRRRPVKSRRKRCLLIALGVWPETGRQEVLAWRLADSEATESWLTFLSQLEEQGLRGENGLELIIHDGGSGLCTALTTIHFAATEQRCLFHKLRNIWQAIRPADDLAALERKRQRRTIYRDFVAIFQAKQRSTVLRRALKVVQQYRTTQPEAAPPCAVTFALPSPTSSARNSTPPGAAATCAPPVVSNASTATCNAVSAAPTPTIPITAFWR